MFHIADGNKTLRLWNTWMKTFPNVCSTTLLKYFMQSLCFCSFVVCGEPVHVCLGLVSSTSSSFWASEVFVSECHHQPPFGCNGRRFTLQCFAIRLLSIPAWTLRVGAVMGGYESKGEWPTCPPHSEVLPLWHPVESVITVTGEVVPMAVRSCFSQTSSEVFSQQPLQEGCPVIVMNSPQDCWVILFWSGMLKERWPCHLPEGANEKRGLMKLGGLDCSDPWQHLKINSLLASGTWPERNVF